MFTTARACAALSGSGSGNARAAGHARILKPLRLKPSPRFERLRTRMNYKGWTNEKVAEFFDRPLLDLLFEAQQIHRQWHRPNEIQLSTLLSIKTGGCPEDCGYCSQSAFAKSGAQSRKAAEQGRGHRGSVARPRPQGQPAFAWARPGANPRTATCRRFARWSRRQGAGP